MNLNLLSQTLTSPEMDKYDGGTAKWMKGLGKAIEVGKHTEKLYLSTQAALLELEKNQKDDARRAKAMMGTLKNELRRLQSDLERANRELASCDMGLL